MASDGARRAPDELIKANPKVDVTKLREAERVLRTLRDRGVSPPTPMVRSPYGERYVPQKRGPQ